MLSVLPMKFKIIQQISKISIYFLLLTSLNPTIVLVEFLYEIILTNSCVLNIHQESGTSLVVQWIQNSCEAFNRFINKRTNQSKDISFRESTTNKINVAHRYPLSKHNRAFPPGAPFSKSVLHLPVNLSASQFLIDVN